MNILFSLPDPNELAPDAPCIATTTLREELRRLQEKHGNQSAPLIKDLESIIVRLEEQYGQQTSVIEREIAEKYKGVDPSTVVKAQNVVRSFLKRRKFVGLASHFLASPLARELGKRNEIWKEILVTERNYFQSLVMLYETYFKPLKMRASTDIKIIPEKQIFKIFQNIEDIKNGAKTMWKKLEEACKGWPEATPRIGTAFLSVLPDIKREYVPYIKGVSKSLKSLAKLQKAIPSFRDFLDKTIQDWTQSSQETVLPLSSLLMLPIARMGQYETYLKELIVLTPNEHVDFADLAKAQREVANLNNDVTTMKQEAIKLQKVYNITASLKGNGPNLLIKDIRVFIREGPMYILEEKRLKKGYLYLFTDVLVVAELNEVTEEKKFEHMVALQSADVKEIPESQYPVFVVTKDSKKYNIVTNTAEERKSWVADIAVQINEVNAPKAKGGRKSDQKLVLARTVTPAKTVSKDQIPTVSNPSLLSSPSDLALNTAPNSNNKGGKLVLESESFMRALQRQHSGRTPEDFLEQLSTKIKLSKFGGPMSFKLRGPSDEEDLMDVEKYVNTACIKSISTFPFLTAKHMRMNDPIADQYGLCAWSNRLVVALGDGCANLKGQQAAFRAVDTFLAEMTDVRPLTDLKDVGGELLTILAKAHESILHGKKLVWDAGTTSLLTGTLVEVDPSSATEGLKWVFVCVSVGDVKAFKCNKSTRLVTEITQDTTLLYSDLNDSGGRLGPYIYQGSPDLRNLQAYATPCSEDDMIILCTDGVHDNWDAELNGLNPPDLQYLLISNFSRVPIKAEQITSTWDMLEPHVHSILKQCYRISVIEKILGDMFSEGVAITPKQVTKALINNCIRNTRNQRDFAEQDPDAPIPKDKTVYAGRMDHSTCITLQVGNVPS